MAKLFEPSTALQKAIHAGNRDAVLAQLRRSSAPERAALRSEVAAIAKVMKAAQFSYGDDTFAGWGARPGSAQRTALAAAAVVCGTARDAAECRESIDEVLALAKEFAPPSMPGMAGEMLKLSEGHIHDAQRLIVAGVSRRPDTDDYIRGLMAIPRARGGRSLDIHQHLAADPGLKDVLLRIMEIEGTQDVSLASCDKYNHPDRAWSKILRELSDRGVYSRALLLDKTLDTLERGWIQFRSGWFTNFHEVLEPTIEEMRPHAARYLALLASHIPPTVSFALAAVKRLEQSGVLTPTGTLNALRPVFSSAAKSHVENALKLADRLLEADPSLRPLAATLIVPAMAHESAELQRQILKRLSMWPMDAQTRRLLGPYADGVAAVNRDRLHRLMAADGAALEAPRVPIPAASRPSPGSAPPSPLDPSLRITPIANLDELVECVAYVFENDTDLDEFERALGALVSLAPFDSAARSRFAPVARRAAKVRKPISFQLARFLLFLMNGERVPTAGVNDNGRPNLAQRHLIARVDVLMDFSQRSPGAPSLATPTHRHGFIDAGVFVTRLAEHQSRSVPTSRTDFLVGLMRLASEGMPAALDAARGLDESELSVTVRTALGDAVRVGDPELAPAAERLRAIANNAQPARTWRVESVSYQQGGPFHMLSVDPPSLSGAADPVLRLEVAAAAIKGMHRLDYPTVGGTDAASIGYYATLLPSDLESFCADGACTISRNLDWWQAQWQDKVYLQELLARRVPMKPMATLLLAAGLAGKEPGQTAVAVDVLAHAGADGRLDAGLLGSSVAELLRTGHAMCSRYARSLRAALRIDAGVARTVFEVLCAAVVARPADPPKDTAALLELLLEVCVAQRFELPVATNSALEAMQIGGKGKRLRAELIARHGQG